VDEEDEYAEVSDRLLDYIRGGVGAVDHELADQCRALLKALPPATTLVHGDFHTGNVFLQDGEPLLIDMDRISRGNPIAELSDLYYFYVMLGEDDPSVVEDFMGFSYETSKQFFDSFLRYYLGTDDEDKLREVTEKASLIGCSRMIRKIRKKKDLSLDDKRMIVPYVERLADLVNRYDTLEF
jgi:thiamine kinase-like enzyme